MAETPNLDEDASSGTQIPVSRNELFPFGWEPTVRGRPFGRPATRSPSYHASAGMPTSTPGYTGSGSGGWNYKGRGNVGSTQGMWWDPYLTEQGYKPDMNVVFADRGRQVATRSRPEDFGAKAAKPPMQDAMVAGHGPQSSHTAAVLDAFDFMPFY